MAEELPIRTGGGPLHTPAERQRALELFKQGYGYKAVARRMLTSIPYEIGAAHINLENSP